ncbi:Serine palmitoyltransferase 2 [Astathelohania contejeani]|uniref:serine C-palmitoyltransferase n=1 Tax=Astathelohania contejeani TaxID=164912 RepID=A0ABQ7HXX7_9MICR|nr:Serine palmitoyltransferase 2 [Thelohania contejeani]
MDNRFIPIVTLFTTYYSYLMLIIFGYIRDIFGIIFQPQNFRHLYRSNGIQPLYSIFESFYARRLYNRLKDCWNRPIRGVPGRKIQVLERISNDNNNTLQLTGNIIKCLNLSSYNYMGFATNEGSITKHVLEAVSLYPVNYAAPVIDIGLHPIIRELELTMAEFLYQEDCIVFPMGFGTNSCNIPVLLAPGSLILSDELNHVSIITGSKMSFSTTCKFPHNNMKRLEELLIFHISQGQPGTHRDWDRIFVLVEGIYSMEGTIVKLPELIELKKKYKFYLFVDEAHSIGAIGKTGRGVCEYTGVDFRDVDILMGTFTKGFGSSGGYIAGNKKIINYLRRFSDFTLYGEQMSPIVAMQTLQALKCLKETKHGKRVTRRLHRNTREFRSRLEKLGFVLFGHKDSPVVPILICNPGKLAPFSRMCLERGVAVVVVGHPATPVITSRARICISASHTRSDILSAVNVINEVGSILGMKKNK